MAIQHKFRKGKSLFVTTLVDGIGTGTGDTITLASAVGLPTDTEITLTFGRIDETGGLRETSLTERITGVINGNYLTNYTRAIDNTSEQAHLAGTVVEYIYNAQDMNDLTDGLLINHTQAGLHDLQGTEMILDADGDTSITADDDDIIDVKIAGADDFDFYADVFRAREGSQIKTDTINETTSAAGVTIDGALIKDGNVTTLGEDFGTVNADASAVGMYKGGITGSFADDTAISFTPGSTLGMIFLGGRHTNYKEYLIAIFRAQATLFIQPISASTNVATTTGALAGTTGTDGKLTVSVHTDNKIYIENRLGLTISIYYVLLGN